MSALPPKADMCGAARDVRFGPKADVAARQNAVNSYPFFVDQAGKTPSVPIWSKVDSLKVPIASASSGQTHRKPSVHFRYLCLQLPVRGLASRNLARLQNRRISLRSRLLSICTWVPLL